MACWYPGSDVKEKGEHPEISGPVKAINIIDELFAPDVVNHVPDSMPEMRGRAGVKRMFRVLRTACPDTRYTLKIVGSDKDEVALAWTLHGFHSGQLAGIAPTGKPLPLMGTAIYRIDNTQIVKVWGDADCYTVIQQIKAVAACATAFRASHRGTRDAKDLLYSLAPAVDGVPD